MTAQDKLSTCLLYNTNSYDGVDRNTASLLEFSWKLGEFRVVYTLSTSSPQSDATNYFTYASHVLAVSYL